MVSTVVTTCGNAKSTLYHYFNSKSKVFGAVIEMELIGLRMHVKSRVEEHSKSIG